MTSFRRDVQGLRAVAVLAVVGYHYRLGLEGGYLGVDSFFVISGFVVGGLLHRELETSGRVRITQFLRRRFLRLAPALSLVVAVVILLQSLFFLNAQARSTSVSTGISSLLGVSNFFIADQTGGYFGERAERNPLLHTWSLSAEWQFYALIFALFLIFALAARTSRKVLILVTLWSLSLASFLLVFSDARLGFFEVGGFYSPFARFWEFAAGVLLIFFGQLRGLSPVIAEIFDWTALSLLLASFLIFNYSFDTPGWSTLIPVGATAWLIFSGGAHQSSVSRLLSTGPMVWLGNLSYSLYLWHWPIYVMWVQYGLTPYPEGWYLVCIVAGTLAVAWVSKRFVEDPFRTLKTSNAGQKLRTGVGVFVVAALITGFTTVVDRRLKDQPLWASEVKTGDVGVADFENHLLDNFVGCDHSPSFDDAERRGFWLKCLQSVPNAEQTVALVGDSHAQHLFVGLAENLKSENLVFLVDDALPVSGTSELVDSNLEHVEQSDGIHTVVITSYWARRGVPVEELQETIERFESSGKRVFLTDGTPVARHDIGACKWPRHVFAEPQAVDCVSNSGGLTRQQVAEDLELLTRLTGAKLISTYDLFCSEGDCSISSPDQTTILYRDRDHLNIPGSRLVGAVVGAAVR